MYIYLAKKNCLACDQQERYLWAMGLPYERIDVDERPELAEGRQLPAVLREGVVLVEGAFSEEDLARALGRG
ncbi:glutaredoxin family protein [Oceanithermus profundus]|uniref:Glutaredoxin 2 n=1 Tax=Oceanithermus profundus (strain DSM 14977 / NBRC 100410 / VKM B-2274 / 506) TaxID=670487 RepID=E4UAF3_OCEP5|nr:thioredoxin [Oceanithermus profundus]ADR37658.1 glutaredoxin 2 [Oceanithermus profundus DSM 14977]